MRIRIHLLGLLLLTPALLRAQEPVDPLRGIEEEIRSRPEPESILLAKSRAALLEAIAREDTARARLVIRFMRTRLDTGYVLPLTTAESILAWYWTGEYREICSSVLVNPSGRDEMRHRIVPDRDLLYDRLLDLSRRAQARLDRQIREAGLQAHEQDFLSLYLTHLLGWNAEDKVAGQRHLEKMNEEADAYLGNYRDSEFNPFIRQEIRFVTRTSDWGLGMECAGGILILPRSMSEKFQDYGLLSLVFDVTYKEVYTGLRLDIGAANELRQGVEYNGTWNPGLKVMHLGGLFSAGPMITLPGIGTLTPQAGIGIMNFSPPEADGYFQANKPSLEFAVWSVGVNFDLPLGGAGSTFFLRAHASYRTAIDAVDFARGGYTCLTLGIDWLGREILRDL